MVQDQLKRQQKSSKFLSLARILVVIGRQPKGIRHGSRVGELVFAARCTTGEPQATQQVVKGKWLVGECGIMMSYVEFLWRIELLGGPKKCGPSSFMSLSISSLSQHGCL